jgi:hypothetical protein
MLTTKEVIYPPNNTLQIFLGVRALYELETKLYLRFFLKKSLTSLSRLFQYNLSSTVLFQYTLPSTKLTARERSKHCLKESTHFQLIQFFNWFCFHSNLLPRVMIDDIRNVSVNPGILSNKWPNFVFGTHGWLISLTCLLLTFAFFMGIFWPAEGTSQLVTISKEWKNPSSALCRKRTFVKALPWFFTCSFGLLALGTDLKSQKGQYLGPSPTYI